MLVFYVDEFGDTSMRTEPGATPVRLKRGTSEWFVLAAVGIRDSSRRLLAEELAKVKEKHFGTPAPDASWASTELKGRLLARMTKTLASGRSVRAQPGYAAITTSAAADALVTDVGRIFAKFRPTVFAVAVDKTRLLSSPTPHHPLGAAYAYLHQRVALNLGQVNEGEGALFVADQQSQHEEYFKSGQMNAVRDQLTESARMKPDFRRVLDKPLWVDTDLSTWDREIIQLADVVAYSVGECVARGHAPEEPCYLWGPISGCFARNWRDGAIAGGGFAIHPRTPDFPKM